MSRPMSKAEELGIDISEISNFQKAEKHICFRMINIGKNREHLKGRPFIPLHDLAAVFFLLVDTAKAGQATVEVSDELMKFWGVSLADLYLPAMKNTPALFPIEIRPLHEVVAEMRGEEPKEKHPGFLVVTNTVGLYGAAALLYPLVMEQLGERLGCNYFVLPSSTHDVLALADDGDLDPEFLKGMVTEINARAVSEKDFLSDNVFYYDRKRSELLVYGDDEEEDE